LKILKYFQIQIKAAIGVGLEKMHAQALQIEKKENFFNPATQHSIS